MKRTILSIFLAIFASSCGGGGGGSSTTFTVEGTISGLTAGGLVLQNNATDDLTVASGATSFTFATGLADGAAYAVTIKTQPTGATCSLASGTGTINGANVTSVTLTCSATNDLTFTPDPGLIMDNASAPNVGIDDTGTYLLFYQSMNDNFTYTATSTDGLTFSGGTRISNSTSYAHHSRYIYMSDGRYRTFASSGAPNYAVESWSWSASGGVAPTLDSGTRYSPSTSDNGTTGIVQVYPDPLNAGYMLMIYIGDLQGKNNLRLAVSSDGGSTFTFGNGNVLGDDDAGGGSRSYVDPYSILLPDGRRRLFVMGGGCSEIDTFISTDGRTYLLEDGARIAVSDYSSLPATGLVTSLHDPIVLELPDGRYRIYVIAGFSDSASHYAIVSATSQL